MTQVSETTGQENASQEVPGQSRPIVTLAKIIFNPAAFSKLRMMDPDEEQYARPLRQYEIPPFHKSTQYCTLNEPYLRPTRWCNPREPTVVAMANELGAYELPDDEFAEAAYWFVKTKMAFEICPLDGAGATLRRGTGTCLHLSNVFIALCRAAGIKARYKNYKMRFRQGERAIVADADPVAKELYDSLDVFAEGEPEACIDGKWMVAHVQNVAVAAAAGWPITKFGEDAIGMYFDAVPETIKHFESLPLQFGLSLKALKWLAPASMERMNVSIHKRLAKGWKTIEEAGGVEAYDRVLRMREPSSPEKIIGITKLKSDKVLVYKE